MSTNVSVPEKIYATELYGNHLMDLSDLRSVRDDIDLVVRLRRCSEMPSIW